MDFDLTDQEYNIRSGKRPLAHRPSIGEEDHPAKQRLRVESSPIPTGEADSEGPGESLRRYLQRTAGPDISFEELFNHVLEFYETMQEPTFNLNSRAHLQKYLDSNPTVQQELTKALHLRDYEKVIALLSTMNLQESEVGIEMYKCKVFPLDVLKRAWTTAYQFRRLPELLYAHLNQLNRSSPYSNHMPVINGSGTGKSRMVDQLGRFVFTIPFNLGNITPTDDGAMTPSFPPGDMVIRELLLSSADLQNVPVDSLLYIFLETTFEVVHESVQGFTNSSSYDEQAGAWYNYLNEGGNRKDMYKQIALRARMKLAEASEPELSWSAGGPSHQQLHLNSAKSKLQALMRWLKDPDPEWYTITDHSKSERSHGVEQHTRKCDPVKLIIALDNAEVLATMHNSSRGYTLLDIMLHCFSELRESPLFALVLGRPSSAHELVKARASYTEQSGLAITLQAPFTEIVFDKHPYFPLNPKEKDVCDKASHPGSMVRYGRSGPWSIFEAARESGQFTEGQLYEMAIDSARADFLGRTIIPATFPDPPSSVLSTILDYLLCIAPGGRGRTMLEERLPSSRLDNLRIVQSIPIHRQYLVSHYPSEPLMREALLQQIFHWTRPTANSPCIDEGLSGLGAILQSPLINEGMNGEVIASLLLLRAYVRGHILAFTGDHKFQTDEAYPRVRPRPERGAYNAKPCFSEDLPVTYFIEALFASGFAHSTLNSFLDGSDISFSEAFRGATVRFTGFERAADDIVVSAEGLRAAYIRGFGIIGHKTQKGLDFLLPVRLGNDRFTFLGIQVKNRMSEVPIPDLIFDANGYGIFGSSEEQEPGRSADEISHPFYFVSVIGCTEEIYGVIDEKERDYFARILARRDIYHEHPRRGEFQDLLRRTKAEWFMGQECFDWIEEPLLQGLKDLTDQALQPVTEEAEQEGGVQESSRNEG
ncbi:hypothetical protein K466DRAFT_655062, partial [Polyporus arcularius HHB13444]